MADRSAIEWTDATVNFWCVCTKVGPGCDHCYAETWDKRTGGAHWGHGVPRRKIESAAKTLIRLNNRAADWATDYEVAKGNARAFGLPAPTFGPRQRVFLQSMSDLFDKEVPQAWFSEAWDHAQACNRLELQIVTKRLPMVEKRLDAISAGWPGHAGLIATVVNQAEANRDIPLLRELKSMFGIPWVGLSVEPMLGAIRADLTGIDWVICGGESGSKARPMHPDWARGLRDQCKAAGVAFHFKQWGNWREPTGDEDYDTSKGRGGKPPAFIVSLDGTVHCFGRNGDDDRPVMIDVGKKAAGRLLDGVEHNAFPTGRA